MERIYEYITRTGVVLERKEGETVRTLERQLNELAKKGYTVVSLEQIFNPNDGWRFSLVMKKRVN